MLSSAPPCCRDSGGERAGLGRAKLAQANAGDAFLEKCGQCIPLSRWGIHKQPLSFQPDKRKKGGVQLRGQRAAGQEELQGAVRLPLQVRWVASPSSTSPCGVRMHSRAGAAALSVTAQPSPVGSPPFCCRRDLVSVKQTYQYPDTQPGDEDAFSREPFVVWFQSPKTGEMLSATRRPSIALPTLQQPGPHGCACAGSRAGAGASSTARPTSSAQSQLFLL